MCFHVVTSHWESIRLGFSGLQAEMACRDTNTMLSNYIVMAVWLDNLGCQHHRNTQSHPQAYPRPEFFSPREEGHEPMQLSCACLLKEECLRQTRQHLCYYCRKSSHQVYACPERPSTSQMGRNSVPSNLSLLAKLHYVQEFFSIPVLIDSRAAVNFIDSKHIRISMTPTA